MKNMKRIYLAPQQIWIEVDFHDVILQTSSVDNKIDIENPLGPGDEYDVKKYSVFDIEW